MKREQSQNARVSPKGGIVKEEHISEAAWQAFTAFGGSAYTNFTTSHM